MKKLTVILPLLFALLQPYLPANAVAQQITLDGTTLEIPAEMGRIQEKDDRTFVPIRFIMEHLGCVVNYNDVQQSATITAPNGISYLVMHNSEFLFVLPSVGDPTLYTMDTKTFIDDTDERMYLPIRFLAQAIGYEVNWDEATQTVSLHAKEAA